MYGALRYAESWRTPICNVSEIPTWLSGQIAIIDVIDDTFVLYDNCLVDLV